MAHLAAHIIFVVFMSRDQRERSKEILPHQRRMWDALRSLAISADKLLSMWRGKTVAVIFPTYNEKDSIRSATLEYFCDRPGRRSDRGQQ